MTKATPSPDGDAFEVSPKYKSLDENQDETLDHVIEKGSNTNPIGANDTKLLNSTDATNNNEAEIACKTGATKTTIDMPSSEESIKVSSSNAGVQVDDSQIEERKENSKNEESATVKDSGMKTSQIDVMKAATSYSKGPSVKYTCVGTAQHVSLTASKSGAPKTGVKTASHKRTEKFIIKNVSKVSKMYKVSNLSYKIKPVVKNTANRKCPIIYVGEPAFIDLEDFTDAEVNSTTAQKLSKVAEEIKDSDLYDISKLQSAFMPKESETQAKAVMHVPNLTQITAKYPMKTPISEFPLVGTAFSKPKLHIQSAPKIQNNNTSNTVRFITRQVPASNVHFLQTPNSNSKQSKILVNTSASVATTVATVIQGSVAPYKFGSVAPQKFGSVAPQKYGSVKSKTVAMPKPIVPKITNSSTVIPGMKVLVPLNVSVNLTSQKSLPIQTVAGNVSKSVKEPSKIFVVDSSGKPSGNPPFRVSHKVTGTLAVSVKSVDGQATIKSTAPQKEQQPVAVRKPAVTQKIPEKSNKNLTSSDVKASPSDTPKRLKEPLRAGVEVAFEDGVKCFISKLSQMTHLDDEPIQSWSELKKGMKVAATWIDGLVYDATILGCYFPMSKRMQPSVKVEKLKVTTATITATVGTNPVKTQANISKTQKPIGCTQCRKVFESILAFRNHQKNSCRSTGIIVPPSAFKVTDSMIKAVMKDKKDSPAQNPVNQRHSNIFEMFSSEDSLQLQNPPELSKKRPAPDTGLPIGRKIKKMKASVLKDEDVAKIFKIGTKFLHRWQLCDGESKWYHGEVVKIVSKSGPYTDWDFEVSYRGEDETYCLKLFEDYPTDIRIIGKT